jgi:hypothetical protein
MYARFLNWILLLCLVYSWSCTRPKDDTPEVTIPPPNSELTMLLDSTAFKTPDGSYTEATVDSNSRIVSIAAADPNLGALVMEIPLNRLVLHRPYTVVPAESTLFHSELRTHITFVKPINNLNDPNALPITLLGENGSLTFTDIKGYAFSGKFAFDLRGNDTTGKPIFQRVRGGLFSRIARR